MSNIRSIPSLKWLAALEGLMGASLLLIFVKYPVFPGTSSADFVQHLQIAQSIARGVWPQLSSLVLYADVELYLAFAVLVSGQRDRALGLLPAVVFVQPRDDARLVGRLPEPCMATHIY